jgi:ribonuclease HII
MYYGGIDEAGYGPTLGPLSIAAVMVQCDDITHLGQALIAHGVKDSKSLHKTHSLAPLESVVLGAIQWLNGNCPTTAADVFALLGENAAQRTMPWMAGADELRLPIAAQPPSPWHIGGTNKRSVHGFLIHAQQYNTFTTTQGNKADLELQHILHLLRLFPARSPANIVVDRLGGRCYYSDALKTLRAGTDVITTQEIPDSSDYLVGEQHIHFWVKAENRWPLTALASCIAKYARELHMLLFNRYWARVLPNLKATAGYPEDARRFLRDIGEARYRPYGPQLIRGWPKF